MKIMSRDFTFREKIVLVVLALVLVGLAYYYFVDKPVRKTIVSCDAETQSLQTELDGLSTRLTYLRGIRKKLDDLQQLENLAWMSSYNNSKAEVKFLNDVLAVTRNYSISFANVSRNGNQIRRNFSLSFSTANYAIAQDILTQMIKGENRCLVGDMRGSINNNGGVSISATATFYETMVGGVEDAGLPASGAATKR